MAEPTIQEVFGPGATRLATNDTAPSDGLFIPDSVLISNGIATPLQATAEAMLVSILLQIKSNLTRSNYDSNADQSIFVAQGFTTLDVRDEVNYRIDQPFVFNLARPDEGMAIDPNKY